MANMLIDSGIHETLLTEEQWERMWPEVTDRNPKLNTSALKLVPYGTNKILKELGNVRCRCRCRWRREQK